MHKTKSQKKFYEEINIARGIIVLFVVLGHSFPYIDVNLFNFPSKWIYNICYSFHMAAFFFLSGFVSIQNWFDIKISFGDFIKKKVKRLLVPYFTFSIFTLVLKILGKSLNSEKFIMVRSIFIGESPNESLWFLWVLFWISIIAYCSGKLLEKFSATTKAFFFIGMSLILYALHYLIDLEYLDNIFKYYIFFIWGGIVARNYELWKKYISNIGIGIVSGIVIVIFTNPCREKVAYLFTGILGTLFAMSISMRLMRRKQEWFYTILNSVGNYSYEIYLLSYFIQTFVRMFGYEKLKLPDLMVILLMFMCSVLMPILISKFFIKKSKFLSYIFGLN